MGKRETSYITSSPDRVRKYPDCVGRMPTDVIGVILEKLVSLRDYIRFGSVCTEWRSVVLQDHNNAVSRRRKLSQNHQLPLLLLPCPTNGSFFDKIRGNLYSVTKQEVLNSTCPLVPYQGFKRFIGSSFGWLIFLDRNFKLTLFNPFTKDGEDSYHHNNMYTDWDGDGISIIRILIPFMNHIKIGYCIANCDYLIAKAILSLDPGMYPDDYVLALIHGTSRSLIFMKPSVCCLWCPEIRNVEDVIYHSSSGSFFVFIGKGPILSVNIKGPGTQGIHIEEIAPEIPFDIHQSYTENCPYFCHSSYIVETSQGDLLKIWRFGILKKRNFFTTTRFKVFKFSPNSRSWDELKSLENNVVFLSDNSSLSVRASDFSECISGSIYYSFAYDATFTRKEKPLPSDAPMDMGVFTLETQRSYLNNIHLTNRWCEAMVEQPPIWIVPTFQAP